MNFLKPAIDLLKREPVRALYLVVAVLVTVASTLTGTPVPIVMGEVAAVIAVAERVRAMVTPTAKTATVKPTMKSVPITVKLDNPAVERVITEAVRKFV